MFSTDIIDDDKFLDMPAPTRLLYYDLGMRADDDGFISPKKVMRLTGSSEDDIKVLIAKGFIIPFETGVIVIKDWKMNNYIQKDRYTETIYKLEKAQINQDDNGSYTLRINAQPYADDTQIEDNGAQPKTLSSKEEKKGAYPDVYKMDTQVRLGKVRLGKNTRTHPLKETKFPDGSTTKERFTQFWEEYPRKIDRKICEETFNKKVTTPEVWESFKRGYKKYIALWDSFPEEEKRFIPYPRTWLNNERWNDEVETKKKEVVKYLK